METRSVYSTRELIEALGQLRAEGALDRRGLTALRQRCGLNPKFLRIVEQLSRGNSVPDVFVLTAAEQASVLRDPVRTSTVAALRPPTTETLRAASSKKAWKIGDLPMAGPLAWVHDTLWSDRGALAKFDKVLAARGKPTGVLAHERRPMFNDLVGKAPGGYVPHLFVNEDNPTEATGIDFLSQVADRRGMAWFPGLRVAVDFVDARGLPRGPVGGGERISPLAPGERWVAVKRFGKQPFEALTVRVDEKRRPLDRTTYAWPVFTDARGRHIPHDSVMLVAMDGEGKVKGDGKTHGWNAFVYADWWGNCDAVAAASALFDKPKRAVVVNGQTFSPQDIMALLAACARSVNDGYRELAGVPFIGAPDKVITEDGEIEGVVSNVSTNELLTSDCVHADARIVSRGVGRAVEVRKADGSLVTIEASKVVAILREAPDDISPLEFETLVLQRLGANQVISIDLDTSAKWKNESFDAVSIAVKQEQPLFGMSPKTLVGHRGRHLGGRTEWRHMRLSRDGVVEKSYYYWVEFGPNDTPCNSGWLNSRFRQSDADSPDVVWEQTGQPLERENRSNPLLDPAIVKEIYLASLAPPEKSRWSRLWPF